MGYDCSARGADGYLRRNIFGMGPTRDALERLGMGYWPTGPHPPWPYPEEHGFDVKRYHEVYDAVEYREDIEPPPSDDERNRYAVVRAANVAVLSWAEERPGINLAKFTSNDGWIVTRIECLTALMAYEAAGSPKVEEFGMCDPPGEQYARPPEGDLIPFLRLCADHDGFEVF